jgi:hypothetical protein
VSTETAEVAEEELPSGQFSLFVVVGQYCPGAQGSQSAEDIAPVEVWVVPSRHADGEADPSGQYVPSMQTAHSSFEAKDVDSDEVPAGQGSALRVPAGQKCPALHFRQPLSPTISPAGQPSWLEEPAGQ